MAKSNKKKSSDGKVTFSEKKHTYKVKKKELQSVTTFLKDYFSPFDASKIAKFKAMISKRQGKPHENITFWKKKWKESAEHGTRVHGYLESFVNNPLVHLDLSTAVEVDKKKVIPATHYLRTVFDSTGIEVKPEVIIYNEDLGLAGQADLLIIKPNKKKYVVDIYDYKTNDKITTEGYKNARANYPIEELSDSSFSKYTLQMSFYAYMLEQEGYEIGKLTLLHLKEGECVPMLIEYRKDLVLKLIKHKNKLPTVTINEI
jgi:hypothetical protein